MTDNEIIKALEEEIHLAKHVDNSYCDNVELTLIISALDLINRQKAEIERLRRKFVVLGRQNGKTEIVTQMIKMSFAEVRAEAIKEFAERLKEDISFWSFDLTYYSDQLAACRRIDYLAKEMEVKQ